MASIIWSYGFGPLQMIEFDAEVAATHSLSAQVTSHPVAQGAAITDFMTANPKKVSLKAIITKTPIGAIPEFKDGIFVVSSVEAIPTSIDVSTVERRLTPPSIEVGAPSERTLPGVPRRNTPTTVTPNAPTDVRKSQTASVFAPDTEYRLKKCFDILRNLITRGIPVKLVTDICTYNEMAITDISAPVEKSGHIEFDIEFLEIRRVETEIGVFNRTKKAPNPDLNAAKKPKPATNVAPDQYVDETRGNTLGASVLKGIRRAVRTARSAVTR